MAKLQIYRQGERLLSVSIEKNLTKIGRSPSSDIQIPDPHISREHCLLIKKDKIWFIESSAKAGVQNESGVKIEGRARLAFQEKYKLGRLYSFELQEEILAIDTEKTKVIPGSPTQLLNFDRENKKITLGKAWLAGEVGAHKFKKQILSSGLSIGSHRENDVALPAEAVSQFHARIDFQNSHYVFSDLGSTNGSLVNGVQVMKAPLPKNALVQMGPFQMRFELESEEIAILPNKANRFMGMVSENKQMKTVFSTIEVIASTDAPVVIQGETGTGKELVAKALHELSPRDGFPFIAINCAAIPKDLVESEFFGHEKGSFTGASALQVGAFEAAHQGTLFLDEVAELDLAAQAKLLRALESREIKRVGGTQAFPISIRVISASHKDLLQEVRKGTFREDLFYRLQVAEIQIPPLRERTQDLELLISDLLQNLKLDFELAPEATDLLRRYPFPGNIRELKNTLQRAVVAFEVDAISKDRQLEKILLAKHFSFLDFAQVGQFTDEQKKERTEILKALEKNDFIQVKVSKSLKIPLSTLNDKMKRYGIKKP